MDMEKGKPIGVLIVDDHFVVRAGLSAMIGSQPDMAVAGEAANGEQAVERYRDLRPDVVVMDLRLPKLDGLSATVAIRKHDPGARVVVLTTYGGDEDVYRCLSAGAAAYLLKDALHTDLLDIIRRVHTGERHIPEAVALRLAERMGRPELTPRELEVLRAVARQQDNRAIAAQLGISESTVKVHVSNVIAKLGVTDRTQAIIAAHRHGIVHID
jgi:two-component system NarL family response regulator